MPGTVSRFVLGMGIVPFKARPAPPRVQAKMSRLPLQFVDPVSTANQVAATCIPDMINAELESRGSVEVPGSETEIPRTTTLHTLARTS